MNINKVILITGCSSEIGRYLAGVDLSATLVLHFRDFVWETAVRQMFRA